VLPLPELPLLPLPCGGGGGGGGGNWLLPLPPVPVPVPVLPEFPPTGPTNGALLPVCAPLIDGVLLPELPELDPGGHDVWAGGVVVVAA
jgi:hypothetical protein